MLSFSVNLDRNRQCRYVFPAKLWIAKYNKFGSAVKVMLDTGSFNTVVHKALVAEHGILLKTTMMTRIGGFKGEANFCLLDKMRIGDYVLEKSTRTGCAF